MREEVKEARREAIKKVTAFAIPTIVTFHISALKVQASGIKDINTNGAPKLSVRVDFPD